MRTQAESQRYSALWIATACMVWVVYGPHLRPAGAEENYASRLPRIAPRSPAEALESFETLPGYRIELVAAEPLVADPIAFCFDAQLRLWVIEMCDYSEQETERLGRVARLEDLDGDGRMDRRQTFVTGLSWPTAIACWRDGIVVAEPPYVWFMRDTDDDGVMDQREKWFEGFHRSNVQGLINSLRWTIDGKIHGATSSSGADLIDASNSNKVVLRGVDFEIDPRTQIVSPASGGAQHGLSFNRWGDKFVTSNSDHLQQVINLEPYRSRTRSVAFPTPRKSIATDGPQAEVYRISPVEPWRILRTELRVAGTVPGVVEGGGRAAGYFTGATGVCIMDAESGFGAKGSSDDTALVCDVGSNLVHRKRLVDRGLYFTGERIDSETELVRSNDIWFRPVQLGDGPDGCLYIADMYREVIEHPKSLPPQIKQHLDLTSGRDRGRIWRLVPTERPAMGKPVQLNSMSNQELILQLGHAISWRRLTAHRLLTERNDPECAAELKSFIASTRSATGRVLALHLIAQLAPQLLNEQVIFDGIDSFNEPDQSRILQHALIVLERAPEEQQRACSSKLMKLTNSSLRVRLQWLLSSQSYPVELRQQIVAKTIQTKVVDGPVLETESIKWIQAATLNAADHLADVVRAWIEAPDQDDAWFPILLTAITDELQRAESKRDKTLDQAIGLVRSYATDRKREPQVLLALAKLSQRTAAEPLLKRWFATEEHIVATADAQLDSLLSNSNLPRTRLLQQAPYWSRLSSAAKSHELLKQWLHPSQDIALQVAAVDALQWRGTKADYLVLLDSSTQVTGQVQARAWSALIGNPMGLDAIETKLTSPSTELTLNGEQQRQLREHPRKEVRERFAKYLVAASRPAIDSLIVQYRDALQSQTKETEVGKQIFGKVCAACHALGGQGADVGPPLGGNIAEKTDDQLLIAILDPSREVDPKYLGHTLLLDDGRVLSGLVLEETSDSILIAVSGGQRHRIDRSTIEELKRSNKSLMPEGLESQIRPEDMGSLVQFLKTSVRK